jgi:hypothetical protein
VNIAVRAANGKTSATPAFAKGRSFFWLVVLIVAFAGLFPLNFAARFVSS